MKGLQSEMYDLKYHISVLRFYGYIKDVEEISMDILTKKLIRRKLFKIHRNI